MAKEDLRITKTKEKLVSALLEEMKTTNLSQIKVASLCLRAGVSRATFYNNFSSVEEVLEEYFNRSFAYFEDRFLTEFKSLPTMDREEAHQAERRFSDQIVANWERERDNLTKLLDDRQEDFSLYSVLLRFISKANNQIFEIYSEKLDFHHFPKEVSVNMMTANVTAMLMTFLKMGDDYTLEEKQVMFYREIFEIKDFFYEHYDDYPHDSQYDKIMK